MIPNSAPIALARVADGGLFGVVLPVGCLVIGDAVLGAEVRSGTLHFTWLSPASFATSWPAAGWPGYRGRPGRAGRAIRGGGRWWPACRRRSGPLALAAAAGSAAYVAVFVLIGSLSRRAVVWSLAFVVLGERLLGTALSGVAQWCPGWEARAVYARLGPDAADTLHRAGSPKAAAPSSAS